MKKVQKRDPFYEPPLQRAFYHPSRQRDVGRKKTKEGVLDADRKVEVDDEKRDKLSPADLQFLRSGVSLKNKFSLPTATGSPRDNSEMFDESWPVTERPSSLSLPGVSPTSANNSIPQDVDELDPVKSQLDFLNEDNKISTLSKYIERFRKAPAMSRDEREKFLADSKNNDFWWLNNSNANAGPSDSSTPKSERSKGQTGSRSRSPGQRSQGHSGRSQGQNGRSPSPMSRNLADKADRLLEKIESSYMTSDIDGAVSTVGLGSSPSESTFEVKEQPYRPSFTRVNQSDLGMRLFSEKPLRPEDDILLQWRRKRKLELAREKAAENRSITAHNKMSDDFSIRLSAVRSRLEQRNNPDSITPDAAANVEPHCDKSALKESNHSKVIDSDVSGQKQESQTQTEQRKKNETDNQEEIENGTPENGENLPIIIASPQLLRKSHMSEKYQVAPHVHLSCDIIPCHHHSNNHDSGCHGRSSCHGNKEYGKERPNGPAKRSGKAASSLERDAVDDLDEKPTRDSTDFESDLDYENYKREHLMALHREIEESLNSDTYSVHSNESRKSRKGVKRPKADGNLVDMAEKDGDKSGVNLRRNEVGVVNDRQRVGNDKRRERSRRSSENINQDCTDVKSQDFSRNGKMTAGVQRSSRDCRKLKTGKKDFDDSNDPLKSQDAVDSILPSSDTKSDKKIDRSRKGKITKQSRLKEDHSDFEIGSSSEFEVESTERRHSKSSKHSNHSKHRSKDGRNVDASKSTRDDDRNSTKFQVDESHLSNSKIGKDLPTKKRDDERERKSRSKDRERSQRSKDVRPVPNKSDGQPRASVGSAIGQVVNERLFLGASVSSTEDQRATPPSRSTTVQPPTLEDLQDLISDDETFADDEMLQELRKKRKYFLDKLKDVELLLSSDS